MKFHKTFTVVLLLFFLVGGLNAQDKKKPYKAYLVSNAHFDTQWNWDVQQSISEYIPKTINQNLFLLGKYPNYIFNFEGGIKYLWMKEYYPHQYELMKEYIRQGRWNVCGSTWDATDTNIPSPESFTRNILYGQHFYRDEFGVEGTDIFLPDCFGFGWTLPTIAAHSGLIGFSTQKLQWRTHSFYGDKKIPFEIGLWQGIDGSRLMMVANGRDYTTKWNDEDFSYNQTLLQLAEESPIHTVYHYYGTGDTGGAPTIESVRALEKGLAGNGPVEIISAKSDQLYKDYLPFESHPELPVYNGELLMDVHGTGCYTSQAAMKLYNRRNETLADAAERSAVVADWLNVLPYPKHTLTEAWKRVIWHQFHDDLTGTSLPRAYEFSWNDELLSLKQFANVLEASVGGIVKALDTQVKGIPLVIYNPISFPVTEVIEIEVDLPSHYTKKNISVFNEKGEQVRSQVISSAGKNTKLLVEASLPSVGYVVYDIRTSGKNLTTSLAIDNNSIENSIYKVTLDKNGDIASIIDKRYGKELIEESKSIRLALFLGNESFPWPAWEILKKEIDKDPIAIDSDVKITVAEAGTLRASLCVERRYKDSFFRQYIRLTEGGQADRIDIDNEFDWETTDAFIKAEFPLNVSNPKATYDLGIGSIERGNNTDTAYEVYAQYWADLTDADNSYGVSILNDCKYGWDKPNDNTLRLTLLHTPRTSDEKPYYSYFDSQDFGHHIFRYSIVGHTGTYQNANTVLKAEIVNQPLKAFTTDKHVGKLGKSFSFVHLDNEKVIIKAVKQAEKSDEYIIRLYETAGKTSQPFTLSFASDIISVQDVNGIEDVIGDIQFSGNTLSAEIKPFSLKTLKVKLASPTVTLNPAISTPLNLPYNLKTATYNSFRYTANIDGKGRSFAAELLPERIDIKEVSFELAGGDIPNAVKCTGDTIFLPVGKYDKVAFLVASTQRDITAEFKIGDKVQETLIPVYSGFVGQWGHTGQTEGFLKTTDVAYIGTHTHSWSENKDLAHEYSYMYFVSFDLPANTKYVVLPENPRVLVFAASLISGSHVIAPASDLLRIALSEKTEGMDVDVRNNLLYGKKIIDKSGQVGNHETAEMAIDEDLNTKWCDNDENNKIKYIDIDLGKSESIKGWRVVHAGMENNSYITKEYSLQLKNREEDNWNTVDMVSDNKQNETDRLLSQTQNARYVRLLITQGNQTEDNIVRIYEFDVY